MRRMSTPLTAVLLGTALSVCIWARAKAVISSAPSGDSTSLSSMASPNSAPPGSPSSQVPPPTYPPEVALVMKEYNIPTERNADTLNHQIVVKVDKGAQNVTIYGPEAGLPLQCDVSTGGSLKVMTNTETGEQNEVRCAWTEPEQNLFIPADDEHMELVHVSKRATTREGEGVPMPYAIYISHGNWFHESPPAYYKYLGQNISGGCVRLSPKCARLLYGLAIKYRGLRTTIFGEEPLNGPRCTHRMVWQKQREIEQQKGDLFDNIRDGLDHFFEQPPPDIPVHPRSREMGVPQSVHAGPGWT